MGLLRKKPQPAPPPPPAVKPGDLELARRVLQPFLTAVGNDPQMRYTALQVSRAGGGPADLRAMLDNQMSYGDTGKTVPSEQLYTSQVQPYFRAPHLYISMPGRLMEGRRAITSERAKTLEVDPLGGAEADCSDGVLMTTRAGSTKFDRTFREAFVRPGPGDANNIDPFFNFQLGSDFFSSFRVAVYNKNADDFVVFHAGSLYSLIFMRSN